MQSLASLHTGLYPPRHGVRELWQALADRHDTLAERFAASGYATGGVWAIPFFEGGQGLDQGLVYRRSWRDDVDAAVVSDAALDGFKMRHYPAASDNDGSVTLLV
jgi:arylsulfatase A-like enzyme